MTPFDTLDSPPPAAEPLADPRAA
ncbi:MAG: hypothetical protein RLZZ584_3093, partial [Pseudomonadota bacterium]